MRKRKNGRYLTQITQEMDQAQNLEALSNKLQAELIWSKVALLEKVNSINIQKRDADKASFKKIEQKMAVCDVRIDKAEVMAD